MFSKKKSNDSFDDSGWDIGEPSNTNSFIPTRTDLPPTLRTDVNPIKKVRYKREEELIESALPISQPSRSVGYAIRTSLAILVLVVLSMGIGTFYTNSDQLGLLSFQKLSTIRYVHFLESESKQMDDFYVRYDDLKKQNPLTVQKDAIEMTHVLKNMYIVHKQRKTDLDKTHKIAEDSILSFMEMVTSLSDMMNLVGDANTVSKSKQVELESKTTQLMNSLKEQIALLIDDVHKNGDERN
jgi:hypothetical protein